MGFITVKCGGCNNTQTINETASSEVTCLVCENTLATPTGGKANLKAKVVG